MALFNDIIDYFKNIFISERVLEFKDLDEDEFEIKSNDYQGITCFRFINVKINKIKILNRYYSTLEIVDSKINNINGNFLKKIKLINSDIGSVNILLVDVLEFRNSDIKIPISLFDTSYIDVESNEVQVSESISDIDVISVGKLDITVWKNLTINIKSFEELNVRVCDFPDDGLYGIINKVDLKCDLDNFSLQNLYSIKKVLEAKEIIKLMNNMNNVNNMNDLDERISIMENANKMKSARK